MNKNYLLLYRGVIIRVNLSKGFLKHNLMDALKNLKSKDSKLNLTRTLERRLSPLNAWSFAFGCVIGWSAFVMPGGVFLPSAGPLGTMIAMEIAALVMLIISYNYSYMIKKFPQTGGEFLYAQNAFGEKHGFLCAWMLSLSYLSVIPLNATALNLILRAITGNAFQFGFHYTIAGYHVYFGEMLLAFSALIILAVIGSFNVKIIAKLQTYLVMILLTGIILVLIGVVTSPLSSNNLHPLFYPETPEFHRNAIAQILAVATTAPMSFVGFDTVPQLSEESNFSPDRLKVIMDTSIVCGAFVYIVLVFIAAAVVPTGYSNWVEYVNNISNLSGVDGIPTLAVANIVMGKFGLFCIVSSVIAAMLTGIIGFYMATSRLLYSMSRNEMIPKWFGHLNKNNVPINAIIFCMLFSGLTSLLGRATLGWVFDMASTGAAAGFAYTSIAACKYAWQEKRTDIIILGAIGFIFAMLFEVLLLVPIPGVNGSLYKESYILLIIWLTLGVIFYVYTSRRKLRVKFLKTLIQNGGGKNHNTKIKEIIEKVF